MKLEARSELAPIGVESSRQLVGAWFDAPQPRALVKGRKQARIDRGCRLPVFPGFEVESIPSNKA